MFSLTNFGIVRYMSNHVDTPQQIENYQKAARLLSYTPWVDVALALIMGILGFLAIYSVIPVNGIYFFIAGTVEIAIGGAFLRADESVQKLIASSNQLKSK